MKRILLGPHSILEALRANPQEITVIYAQNDQKTSFRELRTLAQTSRVPLFEISPDELEQHAKGVRHNGLLAIAGSYTYATLENILERKPSLLVALDEVTDPHNFGAIVRSAVALGAPALITLKDRACPVTPAVVRTSAGATEHAQIARVTNLSRTLRELQQREYCIVGLDAEGTTTISEVSKLPLPRVLVVGSEGTGLRRLVRESCSTLMRIPLPGPIASLNASVAAALAIHACQSSTS